MQAAAADLIIPQAPVLAAQRVLVEAGKALDKMTGQKVLLQEALIQVVAVVVVIMLVPQAVLVVQAL